MLTARALLALLILLPAAALQQSNPATGQAQTKPNELCALEGVVVKSTTGEPARKIQVTLFRIGEQGQQPITETDSNGRFVFANLEPGRYTVHAGGSGYPYQSYGQRSPGGRGELIVLEPGEHKRDIVFRLEPGSVITGTVYDENGNPAVLAQVQAFRVLTRGGAFRYSGSSSGQANDLGEYRLFGLEPGRYFIVATAPGQPLPNRPTDVVYVPTFYPGTADPAQASSVQVNPGDEASGIDVTLTQSRSVHVRGRVVVGGTGRPVQNIYVSLAPRGATSAGLPFAQYGAGVQDDKGSFDIPGVPPGSYLLMANWNDQNKNYLGRIPLDVGTADADGIILTLNPGIELSGRIRADPGQAADFTKLGLWLQPTDSPNWGGAAAQVKADGTFVIENVFDGNYRVHVGGFPEQFYLKSAWLGGADVLIPGLSISHDTSPGTLDLHLALDGGRVDGTVLHNQNPAPGALVVLVPDPPNRDRDELYSSKLADELGRFFLLGLPPGDFKLFAWESGQGIDFKDPEFLKNYENRGRRVRIEANQQQNVQLELIPAEEELR